MSDPEQIRQALRWLPADNRDLWLKGGMAIKSKLGENGFALWDEWSRQADSYNERDARTTWKSIKPEGGITIATLYYEAKQRGFDRKAHPKPLTPEPPAAQERHQQGDKAATATKHAKAAERAQTLWDAAAPALEDHPYLTRRGVKPGVNLRELSANTLRELLGYAPKSRGGAALAGRVLIAPVEIGDNLSTADLIDDAGRKSTIAGGARAGGYWAAQPLPEEDGLTLLIGEGVATVLSARAATGDFGIAALSCSNLRAVAGAVRERYPTASIVILADLGNGQKHAEAAARAVGGTVALPAFSPDEGETFRALCGKPPSDFNDMAQLRGTAAVEHAIASARAPLSDEPEPSHSTGDADLDPYLQAVSDVFMAARGSPGTRFETRTAEFLFNAYRQSHCPELAGKFVAVSAATGAGKTLSALGMMVHLHRQGLTGALVMSEIAELDKAYCLLRTLIPAEDMAVWSSIHNRHAHGAQRREYEQQGVTASARFVVDDCRRARILLTTQQRWQDEIAKQADHGVYLCEGERRELVIVDEEPTLDQVHSFTTTDLEGVATLLSDSKTLNDQLQLFKPLHRIVATLRKIHGRATAVVDKFQSHSFSPCDLVTRDDLRVLTGQSMPEIASRFATLEVSKVKKVHEVLQALKVAAQGRIFFARDSNRRGTFYTFDMPVPPHERTIILDGTAALNEFYRLSNSVHVVDAVEPDYRNVSVTLITPPAPVSAYLKPRARRDPSGADAVMTWLLLFLRNVTTEGEKILIYVKKDFLEKFSSATIGTPEQGIPWEGRHLHFVNFGRGRGSNLWKDCTVYVRLGDHHMPRRALTASLGSLGGLELDADTLRVMGTPKPSRTAYWAAKDSFVLVNHKQDAARIAIRKFDDNGVAAEARLYMVGCDTTLLTRHLSKLFPGCPPLCVRDEDTQPPVKGKHDKGERLLKLLLSTEEEILGTKDICKITGMDKGNVWRTIDAAVNATGGDNALAQAIRQGKWTQATRKAIGLPGKGYVLTREPQAGSLTPVQYRRIP